jgi:hypothetical protein
MRKTLNASFTLRLASCLELEDGSSYKTKIRSTSGRTWEYIPRGWKMYVEVASSEDQKMTLWLYLSERNIDRVGLRSVRMV